MSEGFIIQTTAASTLTAATARTLIAAYSTQNNFAVTEIGVSFDSVSSTMGQALVELNGVTGATTGTLTAQTPVQTRGWPVTAPLTTGRINYTVEPGAQTTHRAWLIPQQGSWTVQFPLGREPQGQASTAYGVVLRLTASSSAGCRAYMEIEE